MKLASATRCYYRVPTRIQATLCDNEGKEISALITNLSYGGFSIRCKEELKKDSILRIEFTLPGFLAPFSVPVQVIDNYDVELALKSKNKFIGGLKLLEYTEKWHQKIPAWISNQIHARSIRKRTSLLLSLTGLGFAFKAACTTYANQFFHGIVQGYEFFGGMRWITKIISEPHLNLVLACLCCYCGWSVLKPSSNRRFLNWLFAIAVTCALLFRVLDKFQLLLGGKSQQLVFAVEYLMALSAIASLFFMIQAEKFFKHYDSVRDRELIGPTTSPKPANL